MKRARNARRAAACVLVGLLAPFGGCARRGPRAAASASVIALMGDEPVAFAPFAVWVKKAAGDEPKNVSPQVASSLLDQYLDEVLLDRAAGEAVSPVGATAAEKRRALIAQRARLSTIADEEVKKEYDAHPDRYRRPAVVRLSQLLLESKEKADEAARLLQKGTPWAEVSRQLSIAPNASTGGELGLLARTDLPRDFEKAIWTLPAGKTTAPLAAPHGYHVFRVEERFEERTIPFDEAAPALRLSIAEERSTAAVEAIVAEARKAHPVRIVEEHLPFPYVGVFPRFAP
ncbi:MAG TPA: peptidylprolyl isomerase [Thermoanaerobaculia bacterium]|nr:peptidylprolyl isomerase [Thermoanaerobaculia bacterium]